MSLRPNLLSANEADQVTKENLTNIQHYIDDLVMGKFEGEFFELTFPAAVTNQRVSHTLGFLPKDLIQTSKIGAGAITYNFERFTEEFLDITTTGAVTVRAFIGRYDERRPQAL